MKYRQVNCPDNFVSDSVNINNTLFLVCRQVSSAELKTNELTIGLILGLGILLGILLILFFAYIKVKQTRRLITTAPIDAEKALSDEIASRNYDFQKA
jgi:hypothetical protein